VATAAAWGLFDLGPGARAAAQALKAARDGPRKEVATAARAALERL